MTHLLTFLPISNVKEQQTTTFTYFL